MALDFYFDLGSPYAYLTAERLAAGAVPGPVAWRPISLGALFKQNGRGSWALAGAGSRAQGIAEVERRAHEMDLPPVRWPDPWPSHYLLLMRAATWADRQGRGPEFALQALRLAFVEGRDVALPAQVEEAASRAGLDRTAVVEAAGSDDTKRALRRATDEAHARGVIGVPTIAVGTDLFWGDDRVAEAAVAARA